ncbi:ComEA family DNA-binding protein [Saccharibacillus sacchari]|uniref:Helix-hairpin-helix domain-containing protein n=1 Tax=Saccharibacillus sacchari TaxID=456493 RepID=A0ACC6PB98_9BACL
MKKELLWAACLSVVLGAGVLFLSGGNDAEGVPWKPLNEQLETALAVQEGTLEATAETGEGNQVATQESSDKEANVPAATEPLVSQPTVATSVAATGMQDTTPVQPAASTIPVPISDGKIHINSADANMLMELPGIGEKKAQAILDYRTQNGPFQNVTDIVKVKGIGAKMLEKMLPDLAL